MNSAAFASGLLLKNIAESGIDRILSDGKAALNRAVKWQELDEAPHIFLLQTAEDRRSRDPMGRPIVPSEMALLFDAAKSRHALIYLIIATKTPRATGRNSRSARRAVRCNLTTPLDLNPPGRRQNKKFRPLLPATPTLSQWLKSMSRTDTALRVLWAPTCWIDQRRCGTSSAKKRVSMSG